MSRPLIFMLHSSRPPVTYQYPNPLPLHAALTNSKRFNYFNNSRSSSSNNNNNNSSSSSTRSNNNNSNNNTIVINSSCNNEVYATATASKILYYHCHQKLL